MIERGSVQTPENEGLRARGMSVHPARLGSDKPITLDIDLDIRPGEAVAIVGESGSGKSLHSRAILDLLPDGLASSGRLTFDDLDLTSITRRARRRLRGQELALVMQDPFTMLNPLLRCGEQVVEALASASRQRRSRRHWQIDAVQRLAEVGITDPSVAERYPFELSGGMRQRVAIAAAIARRPRILVADEPTTALDVTTQHQILELLGSLRHKHDMALLLITHDLRVAFENSDRVYVMYAGSVLEVGSSHSLRDRPLHPYTSGLLLAEPPHDRRVERLEDIEGRVPAPGERPQGCPFAPRCPWAQPRCSTDDVPKLREFEDGHSTRCLRIEEIEPDLSARHAGHLRRDDAAHPAATARDRSLVIVEGLRKEYAGRRRGQTSTVAIESIDLQVAEGEAVGIVGESGSGKTTTGRVIVGLETPTSGSVAVGDIELSPSTTRREREALHGLVQMAFQDPYSSMNPARTIGAALYEAMCLTNDPPADGRTAVRELLDRVGLPAQYSRRRPGSMSGGERQRAAIARALARRPRLLVCDEVVSALDVSVQAQILNLLRELRDDLGLAYLFITHDLAVIRQVTDRVYVLRQGVVVEEGPTPRVLDAPEHEYTRQLIASIPGANHRARTTDPERNPDAHTGT